MIITWWRNSCSQHLHEELRRDQGCSNICVPSTFLCLLLLSLIHLTPVPESAWFWTFTWIFTNATTLFVFPLLHPSLPPISSHCMFVCSICMCSCGCVHMCTEAQEWYQCLPLSLATLFFETKFLTKPRAHWFRLSSQWAPGIHLTLHSSAGYSVCCCAQLLGAGGANPGPHACRASNLLTKPSPSPAICIPLCHHLQHNWFIFLRHLLTRLCHHLYILI